jgi:hypothetical protein
VFCLPLATSVKRVFGRHDWNSKYRTNSDIAFHPIDHQILNERYARRESGIHIAVRNDPKPTGSKLHPMALEVEP